MPPALRRRRWLLGLGWVVLAAGCATAREPAYLPPDAVRLADFLEPPPAAGTPAGQADLDAVLMAQAQRSPASAAAARADAEVSVFRFADVLGPAFQAGQLPVTGQLFQAVGRDATRIGLAAKLHWRRPRPAAASDQVVPLLQVSGEGAYPSGHAMYGCLTAALLGVMVPEQRTALLERGRQYGWNRVVAGVHYPTDVAAGCTSGKIVAAVLLQQPRFQAELAAATAETRRNLGLAMAPVPAAAH